MRDFRYHFRMWFAPPHPLWKSRKSRRRVHEFLREAEERLPGAVQLNLGCGPSRLGPRVVNLDLYPGNEVDVRGDILLLPFREQSIDTVICTAVLEHVSDPLQAVREIHRVLKVGGRVFLETPFMQTAHASPSDYYRWTPEGLHQLLRCFEVLELRVAAGPASGLAWLIQETLAMLFSFRSTLLYKLWFRIFGWLAYPVAWLDTVLEQHPMAWHAASGFAVVAVKLPSLQESKPIGD